MVNTMDELYRLQVTIAADPASVYNALTSAEALETWFAESAEVDLPARRYDFWGRYTPETPDREQGRHEIIAAEQDSLLRFAWPLEGVTTEVEYRLHPRDGATILTVTHTGCGKDTSAPCAPEDFWFLVLENLRRHVEGRPVHSRFDFHTLNSQEDIRHEIEIDAPADVVFSKLVEPAELNRWIAYNAAVEPQVGGTFDLGWGEGLASKILEIEPPGKLVLRLGRHSDRHLDARRLRRQDPPAHRPQRLRPRQRPRRAPRLAQLHHLDRLDVRSRPLLAVPAQPRQQRIPDVLLPLDERPPKRATTR